MTGPEASALHILGLIRRESDAIGVAVSFGKDSLAALDLCRRVFPRVEGYYLYRVADLRCVADWAEEVRRRHGVSVRMYPHFDLTRCYRHSVLRHPDGARDVKTLTMADVEAAFRAEAGVTWLAMGWRRNDSLNRALVLKANGGVDFKARRVFPLRTWRRQDVYAYLEARAIPLPPGLGRKDQGGLDFDAGALRWLAANYPDDWRRWKRDFPLSEAMLAATDQSDDSQSPGMPRTGKGATRRGSVSTQA